MTRRAGFYILLSLLFIVVDSTLIKFLSIANIVPDILIIWIVYIAIREGQVAGTTAGFLVGLVMSLMGTTGSMLGLAALTKTFAGFIAGYFYNENKIYNTLGGYQFIVLVALASLVHNTIYFVIFLQGSGMSWSESVLYYGVPTTAYTAAVALLPMFAFARKYLS
ncbi:MAG: rod shape-determining protein MreD [Bacteroidota bacterium]